MMQHYNIMKWIYLFWVIICLVLIAQINIYHNRLDDAANYIQRLEQDFPDYLDVSAESEEYAIWYKVY